LLHFVLRSACLFFIGGPKLRKWYGAPDIPAKDGSVVEDDDQSGSL
jgi:hypothetical protein